MTGWLEPARPSNGGAEVDFASARESYQLLPDGETPEALGSRLRFVILTETHGNVTCNAEENCKSPYFSADRGSVSGEG